MWLCGSTPSKWQHPHHLSKRMRMKHKEKKDQNNAKKKKIAQKNMQSMVSRKAIKKNSEPQKQKQRLNEENPS